MIALLLFVAAVFASSFVHLRKESGAPFLQPFSERSQTSEWRTDRNPPILLTRERIAGFNMPLLRRLGIFAAVGSTAYVALSAVFWLYCIVGGHDLLEMFYGGTATIVLALAAGVEFAWLAPSPSRTRY